ncbi:MAG: glycoside hydrolase family 78 protein [Paludisphaera borealis]|uniref:glycoside hydrolase family 78 protein n=1 Tax=Paludisphaera borealis TaxID=1387353 RepID=UPI00283AC349|nr:glycoside hydrolase family 78 protein [Paludisphaera borealis]MDR3621228.1 glycoside hydrolase family 78 protein [Paludisphaera borealis]
MGLLAVLAAGVVQGQAGAQQLAQVQVLGLSPLEPRTEHRANPLGIDATAPRLSWTLGSSQRGQKQTAYQILVASDDARLAKDEGDLWDTGKVAGDDTTGVAYAGKPLKSQGRYAWKVKVWDRDDKPSTWSAPAFWTLGLLAPEDWKADWIGFDKNRGQVASSDADFGGAKWIWHAADQGADKPKGHRLFVAELEIPADAVIDEAKLLSVADDGHKFTINGTLAATGTSFKVPVETDAARLLKPGVNTLRAEVENGGPSPAGLLARLTIKLKDGRVIERVTDASWKTLGDPGANWHNRPIDVGPLPAAEVVAEYGGGPWGKLKITGLALPKPSYLRTTFDVAKPVRRATVYTTALGIHDVHLNGARVSDDYFNPGWTDYTKRVYYRTYDVTKLVQPGKNAIGAILADGWYSGYVGFGKLRDHYGKQPRIKTQLVVDYEDGTSATVATGPGWKASTGPILEADFLMGETFDARLDKADWSLPTFQDDGWEPVVAGAEMQPVVQAHPGPPVTPFVELQPRTFSEPKPGVYVLDYGQNFAGVPRLRLRGEPGQKIVLRFAERLNPDGTIYTTNLREARCVDTYICSGADDEDWSPRFTFHGYQYLEITGLKTPPLNNTVVGLALSSATPVVGRFQCSDPMLNQLHSNAYWTQRANFIDIPTDCPQRDERLGWTGDAQVYIRTATLNCDVQSFFNKWLVDLTDGQRGDGQFPMVAPVKVAGDDGGPAWAEAGVVCPWTIYEVYGDRRVLERQYPSMVKYVDFLVKRSKPDLLPPDKYHCFGDWLSINADTPKDVIYSAYFALAARLTAQAAEALGKPDDAARFKEIYQKIKESFNKAYVADDGRIKGDTQAVYVLALANDLVDGPKARLAAAYLVEDIEKKAGHLSTGFIGTKDLMLVLSKIGRRDVAYRLLFNDTFPSWGFSIKQGATSIWERWDGWTPEKGFQDPGMNSFAHYSFGAVYQWMVENIGGIKSDGPAYKRIVVAPHPGDRLTHATVSYRSIQGEITSAWTKADGRLTLDVTIPTNTTATVVLPSADLAAITEGGRPLAQAEGVKVEKTEAGQTFVVVGSGQYSFNTPTP